MSLPDAKTLIGGAIVSGFLILTGALLVTQADREILLILAGSLSTMAGTVVAYYFGSTKGSSHKDETIRNFSTASK